MSRNFNIVRSMLYALKDIVIVLFMRSQKVRLPRKVAANTHASSPFNTRNVTHAHMANTVDIEDLDKNNVKHYECLTV